MSGKHVLLWIAALLALAVAIALGALVLRGLVRDEPMGLAHLAEAHCLPLAAAGPRCVLGGP